MLEKLKTLQVNYALIVFVAFAIKMLVTSPSIADATITLVFGSLYGYTQYLKRFQPYKLDEAVMRDLAEVKSALSKINMTQATGKLLDKKYF